LSPDLATALRTETPTAPEHLRDRVAQIAATPPPARRSFPVRRLLALGMPAALAASVVAAAVIGLVSSGSPPPEVAMQEDAKTLSPATTPPRERLGDIQQAPLRAAAPAPTPGRAQDYRATLTVLVDGTSDLSSTTQRALRTTRRLGGYIVTVDYGTPEPSEGTASLRVRIPVSRVQAAIVQFSGLGQILAQQTQISDLQQPLDELTRRIRQLERTGGSSAEIAALRRQRAEINRRAAFATVNLDLTTHEPQKSPATPGRLDRAIDDATGVLAAELAIGAYVLIVAAPILLLLAMAFLGSRAYRRHADQRLLERA
jgi:Domain of unknown function (DUF4349)